MKKYIAYIAHQITPKCILQRKNEKNVTYAGLQKSTGVVKILQDAGFEVNVYSPSIVNNRTKNKFNSFYENRYGYKIFHATSWDLRFFNFLVPIFSISWELWKNRKSIDMLIYYNYDPISMIPAMFAKLFLNKKIFLECEDGGLQITDKFVKKLLYSFMKWCSNKLSSGFIFVNYELRKKFDFKKPYILCPGVLDWELLKDATKNKQYHKNIIISYTGILSKHFGFDELLEYINNIPKNVELHITGKYWDNEIDLNDYIVSKKLKNVYFHGILELKEYNELLKKSDYFLLLNDSASKFKETNFPSKFFVYLSALKPVITTKDINIDGIDKVKSIRKLNQASDIKMINTWSKTKLSIENVVNYHKNQIQLFRSLLYGQVKLKKS